MAMTYRIMIQSNIICMASAFLASLMIVYYTLRAVSHDVWWILPIGVSGIAFSWFIAFTAQLACVLDHYYSISYGLSIRRWGMFFVSMHALAYAVTVLLYSIFFAGFVYALTVFIYGIFSGLIPEAPGKELLLELVAVQCIALNTVLLGAYMQRGMSLLVRTLDPNKGYFSANRIASATLHAPTLVASGYTSKIIFMPMLALILIWVGFGRPWLVYSSLLIAELLFILIASHMGYALLKRYEQRNPN
jgi:hypothetical protein